MPRAKAIAVWIGIVLLVAAGVYPPLTHTYRSYGWLFTQSHGAQIDLARLVVEWAIIAAVSAGLYFAPPNFNARNRTDTWRMAWNNLRAGFQRKWLIGIGVLILLVVIGGALLSSGILSRPTKITVDTTAEAVSAIAIPTDAPASFVETAPVTRTPHDSPRAEKAQESPPLPIYVAIPSEPRCTRPTVAPNGQPWPVTSNYVFGSVGPIGHSTMAVDNTQNNSDMLVKLFDRKPKRPAATRIFFLRAHEQFALKNVAPSEYDIRYEDLDSCTIWRSEPFSLSETEDQRQIRATDASLTLYEIPNGNTQPTIIGPQDFQ